MSWCDLPRKPDVTETNDSSNNSEQKPPQALKKKHAAPERKPSQNNTKHLQKTAGDTLGLWKNPQSNGMENAVNVKRDGMIGKPHINYSDRSEKLDPAVKDWLLKNNK